MEQAQSLARGVRLLTPPMTMAHHCQRSRPSDGADISRRIIAAADRCQASGDLPGLGNLSGDDPEGRLVRCTAPIYGGEQPDDITQRVNRKHFHHGP